MNVPWERERRYPLSFVQTTQMLCSTAHSVAGFNLSRWCSSKAVYTSHTRRTQWQLPGFYLCASWRLRRPDKRRWASPVVNWERDFQSLIACSVVFTIQTPWERLMLRATPRVVDLYACCLARGLNCCLHHSTHFQNHLLQIYLIQTQIFFKYMMICIHCVQKKTATFVNLA